MALSRIQVWAREEITAITGLLGTLDTLRALKFEADQLSYQDILEAGDLPVPGPSAEQLFAAIEALHQLEVAATTPVDGQPATPMQLAYMVRE
jgi:hypothetical protein